MSIPPYPPESTAPSINDAQIIYMGQKARVCCDRQCGKAWGINNRPQIQLSEEDEDDMNADQVRLLQGAANGISALIGVAERPLEVERRLNAKLDAMLQLLQADDGESIDVDAVVDRVTEGVTVSVKRELLSSVADIVRAELGADNAAQADAIVDRIVDRLAGT